MGPRLNYICFDTTNFRALLICLMCLATAVVGCDGSKPSESSPNSPNEQNNKASIQIPRDSTAEIKPVPTEPILFESVNDDALNSIRYRNGEEGGVSSIVESLGGGIGLADFDRDGWLDIFAPGGGIIELPSRMEGLPTQLLRGVGNLAFKNISSASQIGLSGHYTHGVAIADFDNDGFSDCLLTGYGGLCLWHNMGDGTFVDITRSSRLDDLSWSSSAAWADFNNDGQLDLYVCHYADWSFENNPACPSQDPQLLEVCSPREFTGLSDILYISDGVGGFVDSSENWGLVGEGKGLGVVAGDVNSDGRIDLYVANDTVDNFLYKNAGDHFEEIATVAGVAVDDQGIPNGSMGTELADYNGDLRPDLWAANYERESFALYRNEGAGLFLHISRPTGITALGGLFVGFGSAFLDADADGDLDIAVVNGHVMKYPQFSKREQKPLLLMNDKPRFLQRSFPPDHYFQQLHEGRGLATGDIDQDGHLDLIVSHLNAPPALLRSTLGVDQRSLMVFLTGTQSNRSAIGTQAVLEFQGGSKLLRTINGGGSYLASHQHVLNFEIPRGLDPQSLTIRWPNGQTQELRASELSSPVLFVVEPTNL